jgi:hypothetical protein
MSRRTPLWRKVDTRKSTSANNLCDTANRADRRQNKHFLKVLGSPSLAPPALYSCRLGHLTIFAPRASRNAALGQSRRPAWIDG